MNELSDPVIEIINGYKIVREDLIAGGTKYRALIEWLPTLNSNHFSYTGSVFGYGAYALALACAELCYKCPIYISKSKYKPLWFDHINQIANITWSDPSPLSSLKEQALKEHPSATFLEAGFPEKGFQDSLVKVFKQYKPETKRVWCSVVSGSMTNAMAIAWPYIEILAVCCAKNHGKLPDNVTTYYAPEKYHQGAKVLPPYPAAIHTEAKVWQFVKKHGQDGDAIWNLAK